MRSSPASSAPRGYCWHAQVRPAGHRSDRDRLAVPGAAAGAAPLPVQPRVAQPTLPGTDCPLFPADKLLEHAGGPAARPPDVGTLAGDDARGLDPPAPGLRTELRRAVRALRHPDHRRARRGTRSRHLRLRRRVRPGSVPAGAADPDRGRRGVDRETGTQSSSMPPRARSSRHGTRDGPRTAGPPAPAPRGPCARTGFGHAAGRPPTRPGCRSCPACCDGTRWRQVTSVTRFASRPT